MKKLLIEEEMITNNGDEIDKNNSIKEIK